MCCSGAKWKREVVPDHKFDFIDVREFREKGCFTHLQYAWVYLLVVKSFLVYASDIYTAVVLLASNRWSGQILENAGDSKTVRVPFEIGKWIFTGCIIMSFLLLAWEARKARAIIKSRDISYAFTNVMANNYYSMKSYDHFCFFSQINNSKKKKDDLAFFVFFTFKGWKRLLLADAPRQVINALTLYSFGKAFKFTTDVSVYVGGSWLRAGILVTMIFTVVVWLGSAILLLIAALVYVPLLCYIRGNLKEYCCHKIDKRIADLMKKKTRKRLAMEAARARKEAAGDFSHLKDKKGHLMGKPMAQPTLPKVALYEEDYKSQVGFPGSGSDISLRKDTSYHNMPAAPGHAYPPNGYDRGFYAPQPHYAYEGSEVGGYAGSVHSVDRLIQTPRPYDQPDTYAPPYPSSNAPSYRSQTSLHESKSQRRHWEEQDEQPPLPTTTPYYTGQQQQDNRGDYFSEPVARGRSPANELQNSGSLQELVGDNSLHHQDSFYQSQNAQNRDSTYSEYKPISRKALFDHAHSRESTAAESAYGGMSSEIMDDRTLRHDTRRNYQHAQQQQHRPDSQFDLDNYYADDNTLQHSNSDKWGAGQRSRR